MQMHYNYNTNVCIIGLGFVGTHLFDLLKTKFNVNSVDISVDRINNLKRQGYNQIYTNLDEIKSKIDIFIICLPTLLINSKPDTRVFYKVKEQLRNFNLTKDQLIIIESSVSIGFTRSLLNDLNVSVAFSPERVDPGSKIELKNIPKIISGIDEKSLEYIKSIYSQVFDKVVPVSSIECAEMCKLYENCFRLVNIAYANEMSDLCESKGINALEMINACDTKPYGFMKFTPGLGIGGHCIPINPYYLLDDNINTPILKMSLNEVETRVVKKALEIKNGGYKRVLIIGTAYKPGQTSTENSPGIKLYNELIKLNIYTKLYDPLVNETVDYIDKRDFNKEYILKNFDYTIVAIKQHNIDFTVI